MQAAAQNFHISFRSAGLSLKLLIVTCVNLVGFRILLENTTKYLKRKKWTHYFACYKKIVTTVSVYS